MGLRHLRRGLSLALGKRSEVFVELSPVTQERSKPEARTSIPSLEIAMLPGMRKAANDPNSKTGQKVPLELIQSRDTAKQRGPRGRLVYTATRGSGVRRLAGRMGSHERHICSRRGRRNSKLLRQVVRATFGRRPGRRTANTSPSVITPTAEGRSTRWTRTART